MNSLVFNQFPGREYVTLREDRVTISKVASKDLETHQFFLNQIADLHSSKRRSFLGIPIGVVSAAILFSAAVRFSGTYPLADLIEAFLITIGASCLIAAYLSCDPIEVTEVRDKGGISLFTLYRHKRVAADYENFLLELRRRLKEMPNNQSQPASG